ncbi:hypothetical protein ABIF83_004087 [Bradyrhizobium ottawaense]
MKPGKGLAVLVGMDLRAKHVLQILVLEHGGRDRGRDPEDLLLLLDLRRHRHRMRAGIDAVDDVDLFLADQPLGLVDGDVGLALGIRRDRHDLGLAADAALLVDEVDGDLRADRGGDRAACGEGTGEVVDQADAQILGLRLGPGPIEAECGGGSRRTLQQLPA